MDITGNSLPRTRTVYAIGDVHGCPQMLRKLLGLVLEDAGRHGGTRPRVGFAGDFIDRGMDSRGVLELLCSAWMTDRFDWFSVRGNHEMMMVDALAGTFDPRTWMLNGGAETIESYGVEFGGDGPDRVLRRFAAVLPEPHREFCAGLPLAHREGELLFVHAGVDPAVPLDAQQAGTLLWIREPFLGYAGSFGARIVHGHSPGPAVAVTQSRIGVDTGAGFPGGTLSAAAIAPGGGVRVLSAGPAG
jgi:serine/threonine protein phosphatase 1